MLLGLLVLIGETQTTTLRLALEIRERLVQVLELLGEVVHLGGLNVKLSMQLGQRIIGLLEFTPSIPHGIVHSVELTLGLIDEGEEEHTKEVDASLQVFNI